MRVKLILIIEVIEENSFFSKWDGVKLAKKVLNNSESQDLVIDMETPSRVRKKVEKVILLLI
jgi:hypothetical protein